MKATTNICEICALKGTPVCNSARPKYCHKIISFAVAVPTVPWLCDHRSFGCLSDSCPEMDCASSETKQAEENRKKRGCPLDDGNDTLRSDSCRFAVKVVTSALYAPTKPYMHESDCGVYECDKFAYRSVDEILDKPFQDWVKTTLREHLLSITEADMQKKRGGVSDYDIGVLESFGINVDIPLGGKKQRFCIKGRSIAKNGKELIDYLLRWEHDRETAKGQTK